MSGNPEALQGPGPCRPRHLPQRDFQGHQDSGNILDEMPYWGGEFRNWRNGRPRSVPRSPDFGLGRVRRLRDGM